MTLRYMVNGLVEGKILKQKDKHMKMMTKKHDYNLILQNKIGVMMNYRMMMMVMEVVGMKAAEVMGVLLVVMQGVMIIMIIMMI